MSAALPLLLAEVARALRERFPCDDPRLRAEVWAGAVDVVIVEGTICPAFSATVARQVTAALPEYEWDHTLVRRLGRLRVIGRTAP